MTAPARLADDFRGALASLERLDRAVPEALTFAADPAGTAEPVLAITVRARHPRESRHEHGTAVHRR